MLCWKNLSGCPLSPSVAAETPVQIPAAPPPEVGLTGPVSPETETLRSGASCWLAAAGGSERPPGPHAHGPCERTLQLGEGRKASNLRWWDDWVGGLRRKRRRGKVDESGRRWKRKEQSSH